MEEPRGSILGTFQRCLRRESGLHLRPSLEYSEWALAVIPASEKIIRSLMFALLYYLLSSELLNFLALDPQSLPLIPSMFS